MQRLVEWKRRRSSTCSQLTSWFHHRVLGIRCASRPGWLGWRLYTGIYASPSSSHSCRCSGRTYQLSRHHRSPSPLSFLSDYQLPQSLNSCREALKECSMLRSCNLWCPLQKCISKRNSCRRCRLGRCRHSLQILGTTMPRLCYRLQDRPSSWLNCWPRRSLWSILRNLQVLSSDLRLGFEPGNWTLRAIHPSTPKYISSTSCSCSCRAKTRSFYLRAVSWARGRDRKCRVRHSECLLA